MPIKLSEILDHIDHISTWWGVCHYMSTLFDNPENVRSNDFSALSSLADAVRNNPKSVVAMNDFAYSLERRTRTDYDYFMSQPENKDVVELYNKADRGSEEYRNKLVDETIERGKALIDGFEKETGFNLEEATKESLKMYAKAKSVAGYAGVYAHKKIVRGKAPAQDFIKLKEYYNKNILRHFEETQQFPTQRKNAEVLQKLQQYLISKSPVTDEQAEEWYNAHVKIDEKVFEFAKKEGWSEEKLKEYLKGLFRITNGRPDGRTLKIFTKEMHKKVGTLGYAWNNNGTDIIILDNTRFSVDILTHEFGHHAELSSLNQLMPVYQFMKQRSQDTVGKIGNRFSGYVDKFYTNYTGRLYPWMFASECVSTGLQQLALYSNESKVFFPHGYKHQVYDKEHLALVLGGLQTGDKQRTTKWKYTNAVNSHTALAMHWVDAVKKAIPEKAQQQICQKDFKLGKLKVAEQERYKKGMRVIIKFSRTAFEFPSNVPEGVLLNMAYLIWGYCNNKFPYKTIGNAKELGSGIWDDAQEYDSIYVPFWYTIGIELPEMR